MPGDEGGGGWGAPPPNAGARGTITGDGGEGDEVVTKRPGVGPSGGAGPMGNTGSPRGTRSERLR
jgi:hypothetical protein